MTIPDFLEDYYKKSGDTCLIGKYIITDEDNGFMTYDIDGDIFIIGNAYGNGIHWDEIATNLAKANGCKIIRFGTKKNPKTFERKYKYNLVGYIMERSV